MSLCCGPGQVEISSLAVQASDNPMEVGWRVPRSRYSCMVNLVSSAGVVGGEKK